MLCYVLKKTFLKSSIYVQHVGNPSLSIILYIEPQLMEITMVKIKSFKQKENVRMQL